MTYVFYKNKELCGWTDSKEIARSYHLERPQCKMKKVDLNDTDRFLCCSRYPGKHLFENYLDDGKTTISVITTYDEDEELSTQLNNIVDIVQHGLRILPDSNIRPKYKKLLMGILQKVLSENNINLDIISLYIKYIANY